MRVVVSKEERKQYPNMPQGGGGGEVGGDSPLFGLNEYVLLNR